MFLPPRRAMLWPPRRAMLLPPRTATSQVVKRQKTNHMTSAELKRYWRVYCHKTFGGFVWLCFLIALGTISAELIGVVNEVINDRVREQTGRSATETPGPDARLSARNAAAQRGEEQPPVRGPTRKRSEANQARHLARQLEKRMRSPIVSCLHCG